MEKFKVILLVFIYVVSLFTTGLLTVIAIAAPFRGKEISLPIIITGIIFAFISWYLNRQVTDKKDDIIENSVLKMAFANEGFVTAFEVAATESFRLKDVNAYLEKCCANSTCEKRYTENNAVEVFYFKDSISLDVKKSAKPMPDVEI